MCVMRVLPLAVLQRPDDQVDLARRAPADRINLELQCANLERPMPSRLLLCVPRREQMRMAGRATCQDCPRAAL